MDSAPETVVEDPKLAKLLHWWRQERNGLAMPPVHAVDPVGIPAELLPHMAVLNPPDADNRVQVRLTGSQLDLEFGVNATGKYVDEFTSGDSLDYVNALFAAVVSEKVPVFSVGKLMLPNKHLVLTRRLLLPFGGNAVERIVVGQTFVWVDEEDMGSYALVLGENAIVDHREFRVLDQRAKKTA